MIQFRCPTCKSTMEVSDDKGGTKVPCPFCNQRLLIPPPNRNKTVLGESLSGPPSPPNTPVGDRPVGGTPLPGPPPDEKWWRGSILDPRYIRRQEERTWNTLKWVLIGTGIFFGVLILGFCLFISVMAIGTKVGSSQNYWTPLPEETETGRKVPGR
jgi:DNA-directed RNA polymerase subunit RPC12/RpoP